MTNQIKDRSKEQSHKDCFLLLQNNAFLLLGMGIAVSICMYGIYAIVGFSAYPDEFGYWSPAAAALGYDWSEITGLGSYYSYGYSALLIPILFLFHNAITAYHAAIILNLLMQCISMVLLYLIVKELYPTRDRLASAIIASGAALYPAWLFYVQTTMAEAVLYFALILSIYLMLRFLKNPSVITGLLLAILLVYMYMVHMRCLGTIAAGVFTIFLWAISCRKREGKKSSKIWILLLLVIALFIGTFFLKDKIIQLLYHRTSDDVLSWNDYSSITIRFRKIMSLKGFEYLAKDFCGKLLYTGLSTFGIAYFGIIGCVKKAFGYFKNRKNNCTSYKDFLWIYIFLLVVFQFMVALIYLNGASSPDADRLDNFLHGRYIDFFLPILIAIGLEEMLSWEKTYIVMGITFIIFILLSIVAYRVIITNNVLMRNAHDFTMVGMSFFIDIPLTDTVSYFNKQVLLGLVLTAVVDAVVIMCRIMRQQVLLTILMIIQVILGVKACTQFIFKNQSYIYEDVMMADVLEDVTTTYPEREVVHIYDARVPYIQLVQFGCRDARISVVDSDDQVVDINEYMKDDIILITCECMDYEQTLDDFFDEKWMLGHLILYYNE